MKPLHFHLPAALLLLALPVFAAEPALPELVSDRPDYTESTETIRPGFTQLEGGWRWEGHNRSNSTTGPSPLLRIGLASRLELRLGSDGYQIESTVGQRNSGGSDFEVGAKLRVAEQARWRPAFSVITAVSVPVGGARFSSGGLDPFLKLCWSKSLPHGFDAGVNANFRWDTGEAETFVERGYSLTVGHKLPAGLRGFAEVYRVSPIVDDERSHVVADAGVSRMLGKNVQLDLEVGRTLGARTPAWVFGFGFVIRTAMIPRLAFR